MLVSLVVFHVFWGKVGGFPLHILGTGTRLGVFLPWELLGRALGATLGAGPMWGGEPLVRGEIEAEKDKGETV